MARVPSVGSSPTRHFAVGSERASTVDPGRNVHGRAFAFETPGPEWTVANLNAARKIHERAAVLALKRTTPASATSTTPASASATTPATSAATHPSATVERDDHPQPTDSHPHTMHRPRARGNDRGRNTKPREILVGGTGFEPATSGL